MSRESTERERREIGVSIERERKQSGGRERERERGKREKEGGRESFVQLLCAPARADRFEPGHESNKLLCYERVCGAVDVISCDRLAPHVRAKKKANCFTATANVQAIWDRGEGGSGLFERGAYE